ncbi:MAG: sel1 repeat family protein [Polyangiaceae bacterium]|nr:sel1 repeat family protein [Polyangiaceae bacterium]NUQ79156.1 sel1 repeat family protein [Polyangiaceae bacterium]
MGHISWTVAALLPLTILLAACSGSAGQAPPRHVPQNDTNAQVSAGMVSPPEEAPIPIPPRLPCDERDLVGCTNGCSDQQVEDCVTLASMYMKGEVVSVDHERAIGLFRDACDHGSARGCLRLGDVYHAGVLHNDVEEASYYRKACEAGANLGCVSAGMAYLEGKGVSADAAVAATLFNKVCDRGNASGCFELARLYERGEGVKKNPVRALELFMKSCNLGLDQGCLVASRTEEVVPPRN